MSARRTTWIVLTLVAAGCDTTPTPLRDVGPVDANDRREAARSMSFLLTHFEHPIGPADDGTVIGLDLDDRVSPGDAAATDCRDRHPDRRSPLGVEGVDSQVAAAVLPYVLEIGVLTEDPATVFDEPIESGARLHVVRVGELDDLVDDPDVRVEILAVERPGCGGATCPLGALEEGEVFVDRGMRIADVRGAIAGGRLRFSLASYLVDSVTIGTPMHDVRVDVALDEHGLTGVMGGRLDIHEVHDWGNRFTADAPGAETSLLWQFSDLDPSPIDPSRCARISMAFEVEAVRVFVPY